MHLYGFFVIMINLRCFNVNLDEYSEAPEELKVFLLDIKCELRRIQLPEKQ